MSGFPPPTPEQIVPELPPIEFDAHMGQVNGNLRVLFPDSYPDFLETEPDDDNTITDKDRTYTQEEMELLLSEQMLNLAQQNVAMSLGINQDEQPLDSSDLQTFEDVALASQTMFTEGTNIPKSSKDAPRISADYESAGNGSFPIPTMHALKASEKSKDKENKLNRPLTRTERVIRKIGVLGYRANEDIFNGNANRSSMNKKAMELMNELQATGNDSQIRALYATEIRPGLWKNLHTGEEFNAADIAEARKYWFQDPSHFAAAFWYEINKSASEDEFTNTLQRTFELINEAISRPSYSFDGVRFSDRDVAGLLLGVGYAWKATHLSLKHLDYGINSEGLYEYRGVKAVKLIQEMSTKFRAHEMSGFSPVDIANLAFITENALQASIDYIHNPTSPEFIKSQFILQRAAKIVSDMRYVSTVDPEGEDSNILREREIMGQRGMLTRPAIRIGSKDKQIYFDGQPLRAGSAAMAGAGWDQVAGFTDVACFLFPNLKYMSREELSTLDKNAVARVDKEREKWLDLYGSLDDFDEEEAEKRAKLKSIGIIKDKDEPLSSREKKKKRKQHRRSIKDGRRELVRKNNQDL